MKRLKSELNRAAGAIVLYGTMLAAPTLLNSQTIFTINDTVADAFLTSGPAGGTSLSNLNFGAAGTLAIAPAGSPKGGFDSIIEFNTTAAVSQFNTIYGAGNWQITTITLSLASNLGTQGAQMNSLFNPVNGGQFGIDWLGYNNWVEGTGGGNGANNGAVSFNSIPTLFSDGSAVLGTFSYTPPGNNVYESYLLPLNSSLVSGAAAGGDVSLYLFAADNQISYLLNSKDYTGTPSNHPELLITATAVPEPGTFVLATSALACLLIARRPKQRP